MGQYRAKLCELYESGYTTKDLKKVFKCSGESISYALKSLYSEDVIKANRYERIAVKNRALDIDRSHPKKHSSKQWYSVSPTPCWWTGVRPLNGYMYTHRIVYAATHNMTELPVGYCVHHRDGNRMNNSPDNLELMTHSDHMSHHSKQRKCNDYPAREYTQVSGSAEHPTSEGEEIVCSMW